MMSIIFAFDFPRKGPDPWPRMSSTPLMRLLGVAGVGLFYAFEPVIADDVRAGRLRIVLEPCAASVPGFFL